MSEHTRESEIVVPVVVKAAYAAPTITTLGKATDLTAGPVTTTDESPSGMKG